ncbi:MAG: HDIG domain-containing metalloprotein [Planctomycetota bacterium]
MSGENGSPKPRGTGQPAKRNKPRRAVVRLERVPLWRRVIVGLRSRSAGWGLLIAVGFAGLLTLLAVVTAEHPKLQVGRVMDETRAVRAGVQVLDEPETEKQRQLARGATSRVYIADQAVLSELGRGLSSLPLSVADAASLEEVDPVVVERFELTAEALASLKLAADDPAGWESRVTRLMQLMVRKPLLDQVTYQRALREGSHSQIELRFEQSPPVLVERDAVMNLGGSDTLTDELTSMSRRAGFSPAVRPVIVAAMTAENRPTFGYDEATTAEAQNAAETAVEPVRTMFPAGATIFRRGEKLTLAQLDLFVAERTAFAQSQQGWVIWGHRCGQMGAVAGFIIAASAYIAAFAPRIRRNPARLAGLGGVLAAAGAIAWVGVIVSPNLSPLLTTAPIVFAAIVLRVAYDARLALAMGALLTVLVAVPLGQPIATASIPIAGLAAAVWALGGIRDRRAILAASGWSAVAMLLASAGAGLVTRPLSPEVLREVAADALASGFGGMLAGGVTLFILPVLERGFDIVTGMTLIELRDPKQPLLRELQQRAPGTYNHSLNVASIAETAADSIGADSLLTYVGALYHDIGKMNKPEYFVENQSGGGNKHDKLSPAMSLLVIVGHVKDGAEMAREGGLPRELIHFIEGHHGTTLVEYFYERARRQAAEDEEDGLTDADFPDEVEYRYPGPRPRTREVAILMLADAVESATRALPEPTPARIDQLVRALAHKRLMDGQFDECALTLRELRTMSDSIAKTVTSIYHGRISYPSGEKPSDGKASDAQPAAGRGTGVG